MKNQNSLRVWENYFNFLLKLTAFNGKLILANTKSPILGLTMEKLFSSRGRFQSSTALQHLQQHCNMFGLMLSKIYRVLNKSNKVQTPLVIKTDLYEQKKSTFQFSLGSFEKISGGKKNTTKKQYAVFENHGADSIRNSQMVHLIQQSQGN